MFVVGEMILHFCSNLTKRPPSTPSILSVCHAHLEKIKSLSHQIKTSVELLLLIDSSHFIPCKEVGHPITAIVIGGAV